MQPALANAIGPTIDLMPRVRLSRSHPKARPGKPKRLRRRDTFEAQHV